MVWTFSRVVIEITKRLVVHFAEKNIKNVFILYFMDRLWMLLLISAVLAVLVTQILGDSKMMIVYGQALNYSIMRPFYVEWDDCVRRCKDAYYCMAASQQINTTLCEIYQVGSLKTAERLSNGRFLAIKMSTNETTCPVDVTGTVGSGYGMSNFTGIPCYRTYKVTYNDPIWTFNSSDCQSCPQNFQIFYRPLGAWCMRVIYINECMTHAKAVYNCSETYGGQLSGLETLEEYNYALSKAQSIQKTIITYPYIGFWLDGARKPTCEYLTERSAACNGTNEFTFSDPTLSTVPQGYIWQTGQPDGLQFPSRDCLALRVQNNTNVNDGVDDLLCNSTSKTNLCFTGFICGLRPSL